MGQAREELATVRAETDASLDAERSAADASNQGIAARAQRMLDDLIERDRIRADEKLLAFRKHADDQRARERAAFPARDRAVALEREVADDSLEAERNVTDALVIRERARADAVIDAERLERMSETERVEVRRQDTDEQLSIERDDVDQAVTELAMNADRAAAAKHGDVLGMVTHDLRSPLCVIALSAQSIAESSDEPATRDAADDIVRAAARMERLLSELLDVARIDSGTLRIAKRPHDVRALLSDVSRSYGPLCSARALSLEVDLPDAPLAGSFDYDRIVQVISNVLGNAMKFTPRNGTIRLRAIRHPEHIELLLSDTGPGIHPDAITHIFERFWQIDSDTRRGLGLGLHISEKIIAAHGGRIWVDSELGKGTAVHFSIPIR